METSVENKDDAFPTKQLAVLGLCRLAEPIAFTSILAYSFIMVQHLNGTEKDASVYSGLLISAFAIAETSTIMFWGTLSDRIGRKPVILMGLAGTALSSIIFGFAQRYWVAMFARLLGGALNGNLAVLQTMVTEMVKRPEHEPRAYAVQPFMWSLGSIIGTAMGGFLAEPATYYPSVFSPDGLFAKFPYLLPNLVATIAIFLAMLQGYFLLEETNPQFPPNPETETARQPPMNERTPLVGRASFIGERRPSMLSGQFPPPIEHTFDRSGSATNVAHLERSESSAVFEEEDEEEPVTSKRPPSIFTAKILTLVFALAVFSFHQMESGTLFPVWLLDEPQASGLDLKGGLGFTVHSVGLFMSANGLLSLFHQAAVFAPFVGRVGAWGTVLSITILYPFVYIIPPFLSALSPQILPVGIVSILGLQILFHVLYYPCILILIKNATPSPLVLGKVNGLAMAAACAARTVSPPSGGAIYSAGGSAAALWSCAGISIISIGLLRWIRPEEPENPKDVEEVATI